MKHFLFLWEEKKGKKLIRSCNETALLQGDVPQLYLQDLNNNAITHKSLFALLLIFIFPTMPAYCSFYVSGKKIVIVYVYVLETMAMDVHGVFTWSSDGFNFFVNCQN